MVPLKTHALMLTLSLFLVGCQIPYLIGSAYHQGRLLAARKPLAKTLASDLDEGIREKLLVVDELKAFAKEHIGFTSLKNYSSYVQLDRPYVSYIVSASPKDRIEPHLWWFPIVGHVPYKGYFNLKSAQKEQARLETKNLDAYLRGVSAYSTLGWFRDPVLSSMTQMPLHHFVNILFHELTHANLYIKSSVQFNEKVATFLGDRATEEFFIHKEGQDSPTVKRIRAETKDTLIFSNFMKEQTERLQQWYADNPEPTEEQRQERFSAIRRAFAEETLPQMHTDMYRGFTEAKINNALLQQYLIYLDDMEQFHNLSESLGSLRETYFFLKSLEKSKSPEEELNSKFEQLPLS